MGSFLGGAGGSSGKYKIKNSLRLRSSSSAYLNRTPSLSNRLKWTWSGWCKKSSNGVYLPLFVAESDTNNSMWCTFRDGDTLQINNRIAAVDHYMITNAVYRDPSAHYHVVFVWDSANATEADRAIIYVNGVRQSIGSTVAFSSSESSQVNAAVSHKIGGPSTAMGSVYFSGYLSEVNFIDGQALTPSYFGKSDINGVWVPKKYTGSYGSNGFYVNFSDGTSLTTLGYDTSGNSNNWTCNNVSLTAGVTYDLMTDTPTNNYSTLNPLSPTNLAWSFYDSNLQSSLPAGANAWTKVFSSMALSSGKFYCEVDFTTDAAAGEWGYLGIKSITGNTASSAGAGNDSDEWVFVDNGYKRTGGSSVAYGVSQGSSYQIRMALDLDNGKVWWGDSSGWFGSGDPAAGTNAAYTGLSGTFYIMGSLYRSTGTAQTLKFNFGQRPFTNTPPVGFTSVCTRNMQYVSISNPSKHFNIVGWGGDNTNKWQTNATSFNADLCWIKNRTAAYGNILIDIVRGNNNGLRSNSTAVEDAGTTGVLIGGYGSYTAYPGQVYTNGVNELNATGNNYINWRWKANGAGSSNTDGSITSTVSANQTAGFSVVTFTGTGANATVGHGLGVAPKLIIAKSRNSAENWRVGHNSIGWTEVLNLNLNDAKTTTVIVWNNTTPSSSVFNVGTAFSNGGTYVAYCFTEVLGYSKFGSYIGNASTDGVFVWCGFRPRFLMLKRTGAAEAWGILDTARDTYNSNTDQRLYPNVPDVEYGTGDVLDIVSNGFKFRSANFNSADTYIFAAFAEHPFGGKNVSPTPAR